MVAFNVVSISVKSISILVFPSLTKVKIFVNSLNCNVSMYELKSISSTPSSKLNVLSVNSMSKLFILLFIVVSALSNSILIN